jgi:hypothetical protein
MKHTDTESAAATSEQKHREVKQLVDYLNDFYAEHGRMPLNKELDSAVEKETAGELTYETG